MNSIVSLPEDVRLLQQADCMLLAVGGGEGEEISGLGTGGHKLQWSAWRSLVRGRYVERLPSGAIFESCTKSKIPTNEAIEFIKQEIQERFS